MPQWTPESNRKYKDLIIPAVFTLLTLIFSIYSISIILENPKSIGLQINFIVTLVLFIYALGRLYSELFSYKDFIEITTQGISFRDSPLFGNGWIPQSKGYHFNELSKVDIMETRSILSPEEVKLVIFIITKNGKGQYIGSHLSNNQLMKIGIALKGSVSLSNTLLKLLGEDKSITMDDVISTAKDIWQNIQQKRDE